MTELGFPRRRFFGLTLALSAALLASCADQTSAQKTYEPVEITTGTSCDLDGMLLADYPGPKAQIHYADQERPMFFCDTVELFNTLLAAEQVRAVRAIYVQDMGKANWDEPKGHWVDAKTATFVIGSKREGSMGPTIASFAQTADAEKFVAEYGGKALKFADVTLDMVDLRGGALHDSSM